MHYTTCQTRAACSTCTTRQLSSPKATRCPRSTTAYSIALTRLKRSTSSFFYVDDILIFSISPVNMDNVITNVGKHYEITLDRDATSFLGLNLTHNSSPNSSHSIRHERTPRTSHLTHIRLSRRNRTHHSNPPTTTPICNFSVYFSISPRAARISWPPYHSQERRAATPPIVT